MSSCARAGPDHVCPLSKQHCNTFISILGKLLITFENIFIELSRTRSSSDFVHSLSAFASSSNLNASLRLYLIIHSDTNSRYLLTGRVKYFEFKRTCISSLLSCVLLRHSEIELLILSSSLLRLSMSASKCERLFVSCQRVHANINI